MIFKKIVFELSFSLSFFLNVAFLQFFFISSSELFVPTRTLVMFTSFWFLHCTVAGILVGVSGLDENGINSTNADSADVARLLTPLDSLPVLGEVRPESDKLIKFCSHSLLRSFMFSMEKRSGFRPNNGSANVNAIFA